MRQDSTTQGHFIKKSGELGCIDTESADDNAMYRVSLPDGQQLAVEQDCTLTKTGKCCNLCI